MAILLKDAFEQTFAGWQVDGEAPVEEGVKNLLKLRDRVDPDKAGPPAALAVIVGVGHGYTRPDGVVLAPVTALGP